MNNTFIEDVVKNLKNEINELNKKLQEMRINENFSMYPKIINSYRDIVRTIQDYEWRDMHSEYQIDNHKEIAIWKQNSDGNIKDHKRWVVYEDNERPLPFDYIAYLDYGMNKSATMYYKGNIYQYKGEGEDISDGIIQTLNNNKNIAICGDWNCSGRIIADILYSKGFSIINTGLEYKEYHDGKCIKFIERTSKYM